MIEELLISWGIQKGANFIFKDVLLRLAGEGFEEYVKEFFKNSAGQLVGLVKEKPIKVAFGQAQKQFLEKIQLEFEDADLLDEEIADYAIVLEDFIREKSVLAVLGQPLEQQLGISSDTSNFNVDILANTWNYLVDSNIDYKALPNDFSWEKVGKRYLRSVERLIAEFDELREILNAENLRQIKETLERQAPILPDFDLSKYQQNLKTAYRRLDLDTLAISGWENPMQLWDIFTPQNVINYGDRNSSPISVLNLINDTQTYKYTVVIGDPGAGKSTLIRYKVMQWTRKEIVTLPTKELPILIELKIYVASYKNGKCNNFLEYFCASHIVYLFEKKRTLTIEEIQQNYFIANYKDGTWHEILVLIVNILHEVWTAKLLQCVIDKDGVVCQYQNLFLVANCLRDIRNINEVRSIINQLSTKLEAVVANPANVSNEIHTRATEALDNIQSLS
ncbi:MAG: hypothetical protein AAGE84_02150 [Cyanobacteria bacterium P01_G01_bin.39]